MAASLAELEPGCSCIISSYMYSWAASLSVLSYLINSITWAIYCTGSWPMATPHIHYAYPTDCRSQCSLYVNFRSISRGKGPHLSVSLEHLHWGEIVRHVVVAVDIFVLANGIMWRTKVRQNCRCLLHVFYQRILVSEFMRTRFRFRFLLFYLP